VGIGTSERDHGDLRMGQSGKNVRVCCADVSHDGVYHRCLEVVDN
jgi:hypothetical protein